MKQVVFFKRFVDIKSASRHYARGALFVFCLVVLSVGLILGIDQREGLANESLEKVQIKTSAGNFTIDTEIADTPEKQMQGLMYRRSMPENRGMLFVHKTDEIIQMWMKNTYLSLDMIFISRNGLVSSIIEHTEPFSEGLLASIEPVAAVLELNAGQANRMKIRSGDLVNHPFFNKK